jgi:DNA-binding MarR family transcriptional regulator|tara:strand:+ start:276 stop:695 length:420 start_codon:yes stop_codon:yes gene_type:complete
MNYGEIFSVFFIDLQSFFRKNIKITGATFPQLIALVAIPQDGIEMSSIANKIGIDNSTATRLLIGIEKKGWVRRSVSKIDKRVIEVFLTDKGEHLQQKIEKHIENVGLEIEKQIEPIDRNEVIESLSILNWALLKTKLK